MYRKYALFSTYLSSTTYHLLYIIHYNTELTHNNNNINSSNLFIRDFAVPNNHISNRDWRKAEKP